MSALWSYCRTVLRTSVPEYKHEKTMKIGFLPKKTKGNLSWFFFYTPKEGEGGSFYRFLSKNEDLSLQHACVRSSARKSLPMNHVEMDHKRRKMGRKHLSCSSFIRFLCTYYHILCTSRAYFACSRLVLQVYENVALVLPSEVEPQSISRSVYLTCLQSKLTVQMNTKAVYKENLCPDRFSMCCPCLTTKQILENLHTFLTQCRA